MVWSASNILRVLPSIPADIRTQDWGLGYFPFSLPTIYNPALMLTKYRVRKHKWDKTTFDFENQ